jgi:hypothetical protein
MPRITSKSIVLAGFFLAVAPVSPNAQQVSWAPTQLDHITAWPAPVGHRQPRRNQVPAEGARRGESDQQFELDRALDGKLTICRGC